MAPLLMDPFLFIALPNNSYHIYKWWNKDTLEVRYSSDLSDIECWQ